MLDTICALATAPMKSALSIIRISGSNTFSIVNKIFNKEISFKEKNKILHGLIKKDQEAIDEVVLIAYNAPYSFTGEESVEIICHGSLLISNKIIELLIENGCRLAQRGEFSSRAYMNKKIDLIQAESINDLINAESEESKKISLMSLNGETSNLLSPLKESFKNLITQIEVNLNYPEYTDIEQTTLSEIKIVCDNNLKYINKLIANGEKGRIIKDGIKVAIVGKANVGKSSILNALIGEDKAIVTDIKGTTRDVVEGKIILNGVVINLYDTAGIRETLDIVEKKGIEKSEQAIFNADLIIAVFDDVILDIEDNKILELVKDKKVIKVLNKADKLGNIKVKDFILTSAIKKDVNLLKEEILKSLSLKEENYIHPSIANTRQIGILKNVAIELDELLKECNNNIPIDILSVKIQKINNDILSITGEDYDFDVVNEIFSKFCLGK